MPLRILAACALAALTLVVAPAPGRATVVKAMSLEELAALATSVVHGVVEGERAAAVEGRYVTFVDVAVRSAVRAGAATDPGRVTVQVPGGTVGKYSQVVAGAPRFTPGQEVVLFLWAPAPGQAPRIIGLSYGTFVIERTASRAEAVSRRGDLSGATSAGIEPLTDLRLPLDELLARVRAVPAPASPEGAR